MRGFFGNLFLLSMSFTGCLRVGSDVKIVNNDGVTLCVSSSWSSAKTLSETQEQDILLPKETKWRENVLTGTYTLWLKRATQENKCDAVSQEKQIQIQVEKNKITTLIINADTWSL